MYDLSEVQTIVLQLFALLTFGHFVADYALQSMWMAANKSPRNLAAVVPWYYVMAGHCSTHAIMVYMITGDVILAAVEFALHYIIDVAKCTGQYGIHIDQLLHILTKAFICYLIYTRIS